MAKIKRSEVMSFLNTGTLVTPVWSLIGAGVASAKIAYNPKTESVTYITNDNASVSIESYAPTLPIEMVANNGDAVFEFIDNLRKTRATGDNAETEIVNVQYYETPAGGYYLAEKQSAAITTEDIGGDGGVSAKINYTINFLGDPTSGIFKPTATATFEASPVTTILTTMTIGSVTLIPLFSADHSNLLYTGSVANGTTGVTMASTLVGATIVQKVAADVVLQAGIAALSVGINYLTIEVTVGLEVSTYRIDITRAAV